MTEDLPNPPQKAIKTTLFSPSLYGGRFTRKQYFWHVFLGSIIIQILSIFFVRIISVRMMNSVSSIEEMMQVSLLSSLVVDLLAAIFFFIPIAVKRAHDIGHKGTFIISLWVIVLLGRLLGVVSKDLSSVLCAILLIPSLIYGCILLFKDSEKGTNAYGTSTKYPDKVA